MFTVSVHGIGLHAFIGLYPQEKITGNDFEIDVDVSVADADVQALPFIDYAIINDVVQQAFRQPGDLLETFLKEIYTSLKQKFPQASSIKLSIKKLHPPMEGNINYAQVAYEG